MNDSIHLGDFFPGVLESATTMRGYFLALGALLLFAGLVFKLAQVESATPARIMQVLLTTGLTVLAISFFPDFADRTQLFFHALGRETGADPTRTNEQFLQLLVASGGVDGKAEDIGFWDLLWTDNGGLGVALIYASLSLMGYIASAAQFLYRIVQQIIVIYAVVVSPLMFSFLHFDATKSAATKFFVTLLGVAMWPLGWALCELVTRELLRLAVHEHVYEEAGEGLLVSGSVFFFFMVTTSLWVLVSTIAAPRVISLLIESGAHFGSGMLSAYSAAFGQHLSYGGAAAISANKLQEASAATSAVVGGVAGLGGAVSAAAESRNVVIPAAIGLIGTIGVSKDLKKMNQPGEETS